MKTKKILMIAIVSAMALTGLAATANGTNSGKSEAYVLKASAKAKSFESAWYFGGSLLQDDTSIVKTDGESFVLTDVTKTQTSKDFVLKTSVPGNLPVDLPVTVNISATSFHAVNEAGETLTGAFAFDTGKTVTAAGYSFEDHPIVPQVVYSQYTTIEANQPSATDGSVGVNYGDTNTATIIKGFHDTGVLLNKFALTVDGDVNVLPGNYQSDLTFAITYGD